MLLKSNLVKLTICSPALDGTPARIAGGAVHRTVLRLARSDGAFDTLRGPAHHAVLGRLIGVGGVGAWNASGALGRTGLLRDVPWPALDAPRRRCRTSGVVSGPGRAVVAPPAVDVALVRVGGVGEPTTVAELAEAA